MGLEEEDNATKPVERSSNDEEETTAAPLPSPSTAATVTASSSTPSFFPASHSPGFNNWLKIGLALHRVGSCLGMDRFLLSKATEYHQLALRRLRGDQALRPSCTCSETLFNEESCCETCQKMAKVFSDSEGCVAPLWTNSNVRLWLDLTMGPWQVAKLFAPSMGPAFLAQSIMSPKDSDIGTKLSLLSRFHVCSSAVGKGAASGASEAYSTWLDAESLSVEDEATAEVALKVQSVVEAVHRGVHGLTSEGGHSLTMLAETLQATETILSCSDVYHQYGPLVVGAVLEERVKKLRVEYWEAREAEDEARTAKAEADMTAFQKCAAAKYTDLEAVVARLRDRIDHFLGEQQALVKAGGLATNAARWGDLDDEEEEEEEDDGHKAMGCLEERFHGGIRPEVKETLAAIREALDHRDSKEALRVGLPLLLKAKELLPCELHTTYEYLSWSYGAENRLPQARAAIDKAIAIPGMYCPLALRIKWRQLEQIEDGTEDEQLSRDLMLESLAAIDAIKEEDRLPSDSSRWAAININLSFLLYRSLRNVDDDDHDLRAKLCTEGINRLTAVMELFKQGRPKREQQPFLWVSVQRLLGLFFADSSVKSQYEDHMDRSIACYQDAIHTVTYYRFAKGMVSQETQQLASYRLECARIHLQRRSADLHDEDAALSLFQTCLETAQEPAEIINVSRYRAEFLHERGQRTKSDVLMRAAIKDYGNVGGDYPVCLASIRCQLHRCLMTAVLPLLLLSCFLLTHHQALEVLESIRELREKHWTEIAHFNRSIGHIYCALADLAHKQEDEEDGVGGTGTEEGVSGAQYSEDQEKAISYLVLAHDSFRRRREGVLDAGMTAFALAKLYRDRVKDRRQRNHERAIEWYHRAEDLLRQGADDTTMASRLMEVFMEICESLTKLYGGRTTGDKAENKRAAAAYTNKAAVIAANLERL